MGQPVAPHLGGIATAGHGLAPHLGGPGTGGHSLAPHLGGPGTIGHSLTPYLGGPGISAHSSTPILAILSKWGSLLPKLARWECAINRCALILDESFRPLLF